MNYLTKKIEIPGSNLSIVALSDDGEAQALQNGVAMGVKEYDLPRAFPLMPYLVRMSESNEEVPDYEDVKKAIGQARSLTDSTQ
jgi:hypothetical protein